MQIFKKIISSGRILLAEVVSLASQVSSILEAKSNDSNWFPSTTEQELSSTYWIFHISTRCFSCADINVDITPQRSTILPDGPIVWKEGNDRHYEKYVLDRSNI